MPDVSIVIKATDKYSDAIKTMQAATKAFSKDADGLQAKLNALDKAKAVLKVDVDRAKRELREAQKQIGNTSDAMGRMVLEEKQLTLENARRNFALLTKEASNTEKQIAKTLDASSKGQNRAGTSISGMITDTVSAVGIANFVKMFAQPVQDALNVSVGSGFGADVGTVVSSIISGAISGAAVGSIIPVPGVSTAVGAGLGALSGLASGLVGIEGNKDDAYKSWYKGLYENAGAVTEASLSAGGSLASTREKDKISFATLFGSEGAAADYLKGLVDMANTTPFLYSDLTAMSKTLATYGYDEKSILPVLRTVGDAGAALGMSTADMSAAATALGRMKSSDKATLEYLNILNDRGIGAVGYLAEAKGVSVGDMYSMISKSEIGGGEAVDILLAAMERNFSGSMGRQAETFEGLTSTLTGILQEADNAMGEGYNSERGKSLTSQIESYGGELGEALAEANKAIGTGRAALDNLSDQYTEEALAAVLTGRETALDWSDQNAGRLKELGGLYQEAMADYRSGNAQAGTLVETYLEEARALAAAEYQSGSAIQDQTEAENAMIEALRENTSALNGWQNNYNTQQNLSKGRLGISKDVDIGGTVSVAIASGKGLGRGYAYGLDYVPYDNFPALLHQGERVQTAAEARSGGGSTAVYISGNTFSVREEADVDRVAEALLEKIQLAGVRG